MHFGREKTARIERDSPYIRVTPILSLFVTDWFFVGFDPLPILQRQGKAGSDRNWRWSEERFGDKSCSCSLLPEIPSERKLLLHLELNWMEISFEEGGIFKSLDGTNHPMLWICLVGGGSENNFTTLPFTKDVILTEFIRQVWCKKACGLVFNSLFFTRHTTWSVRTGENEAAASITDTLRQFKRCIKE